VYRYTAESPADPDDAFRRDPSTQVGYAAIAAYAFWLYASGPAFSLLRAELHLSYAMVGLYSAVWAGGAMLVGMGFGPLAGRLPRAALLWGSAAVTTGGAALFAATHTVALTLLGVAFMGLAGTTLLTCAQAILSDQHGDRRSRALTEANVGAAASAVLAPLLLGLLQGTAPGWRLAFALPALVLVGCFLRYRRRPLPASWTDQSGKGWRRLTLSYWLLAAMVAAGIAIEFCVIYFGAELLATTGLSTSQAATAMSAFYLGILVGRVGGSWLTRRDGIDIALLWVSLAVTAAGFLLFWLASAPGLAIAGLFVCGVGVASLYPVSLALALAAAPGNGDTAQSAVQLLGGALVVVAPFLLGGLADHIGLRAAFAIELVCIGASAVLLAAGLKTAPEPSAEVA
jgi:MFS family permease